MAIKVIIYTNRTEIEFSFPSRWVVCPDCNGRAVTTRHIECDGGGFTASEFEDACREDEDFADKYFGGYYDRPCPTCNGRSTIQEINADYVRGWRERILLKAYRAQERDSAERRMGA